MTFHEDLWSRKKGKQETLLFSCMFVIQVAVAEAKIMHVIQLKHTLELIGPLKARTWEKASDAANT